MTAKEIVLFFWETMQSNDFQKASEWLSEDFEAYWPLSSELILGRKNFAEVNTQYPANGKWRFTLNSIVSEGNQVVTDVDLTDGMVKAKAITFHTIENGLISRQIEYWPVKYEAPAWRRPWVRIVERSS